MALRDVRRRWRLARVLAQAERDGKTLIAIPAWLISRARLDLWVASTQHAQEKWAQAVRDVTPEQWRKAMLAAHAPDEGPED